MSLSVLAASRSKLSAALAIGIERTNPPPASAKWRRTSDVTRLIGCSRAAGVPALISIASADATSSAAEAGRLDLFFITSSLFGSVR